MGYDDSVGLVGVLCPALPRKMHGRVAIDRRLAGPGRLCSRGGRMMQGPTADEVMVMLREEGLVDLAADFPADGDLFVAGLDSMAVMQLIVVVEERYHAVIGPEDAGRENLGTPAALAGLIGRKRP